jgi:triosephosphate isomerase
MTREKMVAGNWKLYKSPQESVDFLKAFIDKIPVKNQKQVLLFPQTVSLQAVENYLVKADSDILTGAQNCYSENEGAFTGETSAKVLKEMTTDAVLIGHSERRQYFKEDNELLAKKIKAAQDNKLIPVYCIGETLEERRSEKTFDVLQTQLKVGLKHFNNTGTLIVAYEPVWAIGTGEVATPKQAQEAHVFIRRTLKEITGLPTYKILYGGSVKVDNAKELISMPDIDGFLVGGASLNPDTFAQICQIAFV